MRETSTIQLRVNNSASNASLRAGVRVVALVDKKKLVVVPAVKIMFPSLSAYETYKRVLASILNPKRTA
jgi:hypothetical protein